MRKKKLTTWRKRNRGTLKSQLKARKMKIRRKKVGGAQGETQTSRGVHRSKITSWAMMYGSSVRLTFGFYRHREVDFWKIHFSQHGGKWIEIYRRNEAFASYTEFDRTKVCEFLPVFKKKSLLVRIDIKLLTMMNDKYLFAWRKMVWNVLHEVTFADGS